MPKREITKDSFFQCQYKIITLLQMPKRKITKDQHFSVSVCPARTGARVLQYSTNFIEILKKNHELSAFLRGCCYTIPASSGVYLRSPNINRPINILWLWRGKILHATIRRMHLTTLGHTHPTMHPCLDPMLQVLPRFSFTWPHLNRWIVHELFPDAHQLFLDAH